MKLIRRMARRLVRLYHAATPAVKRLGRGWYETARSVALHMALETGHGMRRVCGVIAALSPRLHWGRNVEVAWKVLRGETPSGVFKASLAKAQRCLTENPDHVLSGPKVRAFYSALLGDDSAAVVDVWMARAAGLKVDAPSPKQYAQVADALRLAANETGESVAALQAIAWVHVRGRAV